MIPRLILSPSADFILEGWYGLVFLYNRIFHPERTYDHVSDFTGLKTKRYSAVAEGEGPGLDIERAFGQEDAIPLQNLVPVLNEGKDAEREGTRSVKESVDERMARELAERNQVD